MKYYSHIKKKNIISHFEKNSQNVEVTVAASRQTIMVFIPPELVKSSNKEGNDFSFKDVEKFIQKHTNSEELICTTRNDWQWTDVRLPVVTLSSNKGDVCLITICFTNSCKQGIF